jgi:hypothetical protein
MSIAPPLGTSWGYGIILGLGSLFALGMVQPLLPLIVESRLTSQQGFCNMGFEAL